MVDSLVYFSPYCFAKLMSLTWCFVVGMLDSCEREGNEFINESKIITVTNERGLFYHSIDLSIILDKIVKTD